MTPGLVLCHGCFDWLHVGHVRHFEEAKKLGDRLMVSVTADRFVGKGRGRPIFFLAERVEMIRAIRFVDDVIVSDYPSALAVLQRYKPEVYVKGLEYAKHRGNALELELRCVESYGGRTHFTDAPEFHTTELLKKLTDAA